MSESGTSKGKRGGGRSAGTRGSAKTASAKKAAPKNAPKRGRGAAKEVADEAAATLQPVQTEDITPAPEEDETLRISLWALSLLAIGVGIITGFGAVLFRGLISVIHNAFFLKEFSFAFDANLFTPESPWGAGIILVPVIGGVIVTWLVSTFAPEAKGHGVPEVMDAIYYKSGVIRPVVAVVKSLASAISIGTGASVGREGPIIQIGAALGSTFGQLFTMPPGQRIILVASGAGAGIASTFNTPIGGVMFAIELMMPEVSVRTFLPVALATGTATFIGRFFFGQDPAFVVPALTPLDADATAALLLCLYALLGVVTGVAAAAFVRGLAWAEDIFEMIPGRYTRAIVGMTLIGLMIYGLHQAFGHYFVAGVGYATIQGILDGNLAAGIWLFLLLAVGKLVATSVSLGAGASGGVFSPSLFMGATVGGAFGLALQTLFPELNVSVPSFAMVGMGAMVGGGTGAAMTAVTMIFEMTRDYEIVLPMILAVALAIGTRRLLSRENIYTLKLVARGHVIPKALHANMFLVRLAKEIMETDVVLAPADMTLDDFLAQPPHDGAVRHVAVREENKIIGVLRIDMSFRQAPEKATSIVTLREIASRRFTIVRENDIVFDVIQRMWKKEATMALVMRGRGIARADNILGVISKEHIADSVASSVKVYPG
ncbi:chloride channel protein [Methyloligella sp. 2.7D]|uniref:chloride channel protein n=1 Tax=unclassified Methyloligella TaxID=2625955 RepID=UPI00157DC12B|nr:chloride channel protein [Methyloligella sp. GL2]QKP76372.1 chloride channel protein [Methyloligella sp. GL2]